MSIDLHPEGELTIVAASQWREQWLAWLTETAGSDFAAWPRVGLDLRAIEAFDSAGVQLLLSLTRSLADRGQTLALLSPPACVSDALQRFGLLEHWPLADAEDEPPLADGASGESASGDAAHAHRHADDALTEASASTATDTATEPA